MGCNNPTGPLLPPENIVEMVRPDHIYRPWWDELKDCAQGQQGYFKYEDLSFFIAKGKSEFQFPCRHGDGACWGLWSGKFRFVIFLAQAHVYDKFTVMHEMFHAWLGEASHNDPRWRACGLLESQYPDVFNQLHRE